MHAHASWKRGMLKVQWLVAQLVWDNAIGKDIKSAKLRKSDSYHKLTMLKSNYLHGVAKKCCEDTSEVESFIYARFYSKLRRMLGDVIK